MELHESQTLDFKSIRKIDTFVCINFTDGLEIKCLAFV